MDMYVQPCTFVVHGKRLACARIAGSFKITKMQGPRSIHGHIRPYIPVCGHIWPYMAIDGHLWTIYGPYMAICGIIWPYMVKHGHIISYMVHVWSRPHVFFSSMRATGRGAGGTASGCRPNMATTKKIPKVGHIYGLHTLDILTMSAYYW